jgi:hypothetical protein
METAADTSPRLFPHIPIIHRAPCYAGYITTAAGRPDP